MENDHQKKAPTGKKMKKMALGRGLDALLPGIGIADNRSNDYIQCDIDKDPNLGDLASQYFR